MIKNDNLKDLEIRVNDYIVLDKNFEKPSAFMKNNNISFNKVLFIIKANKFKEVVSSKSENGKYNIHKLSNLNDLLSNLPEHIEYVFKGWSDNKYEIIVKDIDYKGDHILYVIETGNTKVLNEKKKM